MEDEKTKLAWNLPRVLLPKNRVKLLLNMLLLAAQADPARRPAHRRSGRRGRTMGFKMTSTGLNARMPQAVPRAARGRLGRASDRCPRDPAVLYRACWRATCGLTRRLAPEGEADRGDRAVNARPVPASGASPGAIIANAADFNAPH